MSSLVKKLKDTVTGHSDTSSRNSRHRAAVLYYKGEHLKIESRKTPAPGPNDILIEVKAIALNPIDYYQRDMGFALSSYPVVIGSDIGGIVTSHGSSVPSSAPKPGTRVAAFAPTFHLQGEPDRGAFQEKALIPASLVTPIPDKMSFDEAAMMGMAIVTAWTGWWAIGMPLETDPSMYATDKKALLVWGGSSSVGSAAVQTARWMGYTVYATASEKNHEYLKSLGARDVFDYKKKDVVDSIIKTAKADGVRIDYAYDTAGASAQITEVLKASKGGRIAKVAEAVPLSGNEAKVDGVDVTFVTASQDEKERDAMFSFIMNKWLTDKLALGEFVPSPHLEVIEGGLDALNKGLDKLKAGVSGTKLVVEL
ncbi:zinc-binding oxidoreductase-like protein CipB [Rhizodiscina lignyota]|uniref:Zinc-binding oxidoreductase-like protein CipB n=1 Tax=Rhizodiscina lignyota TaxID=1504668 RepID=A0A9P4IGJ2_9PEZI|nr:zinc-binding oxidoreductase-like protein CipB [Rhizodiscina lignyota]